MSKKVLVYVVFFALLLLGFYFFLFSNVDFSSSNLKVINENVSDFSFVNQNGKTITEKDVDGKVYVVEYFFTTCLGICPKMNANMRRVYDVYKDEPGFLILSHTCMPETDSVPVLKAYEARMVNGELVKKDDGSFSIKVNAAEAGKTPVQNSNWIFLTGDKAALYKMARASYLVENNKTDTTQKISDQFLHTQFFALVDKQRRVRGIYDGLKNDEIENLIGDIKGLLKEKMPKSSFHDGFRNSPN